MRIMYVTQRLPSCGGETFLVPEAEALLAAVLVPAADAGALAEASEQVLASATLRADLGRAGRQRVAGEFDVAVIARELAHRFAGETAGEREPGPFTTTAAAAAGGR